MFDSDRLSKFILAVITGCVAVGLAVLGVAIWAVITLVNHFTS